MATELTWQQDHNRAPSDQTTIALQMKSLAWYIKAFLKGEIGGATTGLWTCINSSDGSGSAPNNTDLWGASFNSAKLVRNTAGSNHSWILLRNATLGFDFCIDLSSAQDYQLNFAFSKNQMTGGSATARPAHANEWTYANQQIEAASITAGKFHAIMSTSGDFHIKISTDGSGLFTAAISFFSLQNTHADEACNGFSYVDYLSNGTGVWGSALINATGSTKCKGRNFDNSAAVTWLTPIPNTGSGASIFAATQMGTTDATPDGAVNSSSDFPCILFVDTASHKSIRGRIPDIFLAPESSAVGLSEPASGPPYVTTVVGDTWHPYNASVVPSL